MGSTDIVEKLYYEKLPHIKSMCTDKSKLESVQMKFLTILMSTYSYAQKEAQEEVGVETHGDFIQHITNEYFSDYVAIIVESLQGIDDFYKIATDDLVLQELQYYYFRSFKLARDAMEKNRNYKDKRDLVYVMFQMAHLNCEVQIENKKYANKLLIQGNRNLMYAYGYTSIVSDDLYKYSIRHRYSLRNGDASI